MNLQQYIREKSTQFNELYIESVVLCKVDYSIIINFISKNVYDAAQKEEIKGYVIDLLPKPFKLDSINYSKIYCDKEIALNHAKRLLLELSPSVNSALINIDCNYSEKGYSFIFTADKNAKNAIEEINVFNKLCDKLSQKFFESFTYTVKYTENKLLENEINQSVSIAVNESLPGADEERLISVYQTAPLIGKIEVDRATYIEDCDCEGQIFICGTIKDLSERQTKNGKILLSFILEDYTGKIPCVMFPSAANYEKAKKLCDGSNVIIKGDLKNDTYRNCLTCMVRWVSFCEFPEKFEYKQKASKREPDIYTTVFPQKLELFAQVNIFDRDDSAVHEFFKGKRFVVFDIETTGLNYDIDRITEIGAITIEDGNITSSFSTLINPQVHIKEETIKLNGIDDELVKNSPIIEDVIPDFYKYTKDCYLVAQNIDFDLKFIKYNSKKQGYYFENKFYDTLQIAREKLAGKGLSNFKLDTLCSYFNIDLTDHHRAWNDALATAKLFIKLINL